MVGYALVNSRALKNKEFRLEKVPELSPLNGALEMNLTINWENMIDHRGVLNLFRDLDGQGDWCHRQCCLTGDVMKFYRNPEDQEKGVSPTNEIVLSTCITEMVSLAPREICSRMHTFMMETRRPSRKEDRDSLIMRVVCVYFMPLIL